MGRCLYLAGAASAAIVLGMAAMPSARADLQVVESNAPTYAVGAVLPNGSVFNLTAGERVRVLLLPSQQTRVFEGKGSHTWSLPTGGTRAPTRKKQD